MIVKKKIIYYTSSSSLLPVMGDELRLEYVVALFCFLFVQRVQVKNFEW